MFRPRLLAQTSAVQIPHLLHSCRGVAYAASAWSTCSTGSISRYFHCTLRETLKRQQLQQQQHQQQQFQDNSLVNSTSPSCPITYAGSQVKQPGSASSTPVPKHHSGQHTAPPSSSSSSTQTFPGLHYSLELSLPHLPSRSPFPNVTAPNSVNGVESAMSNELCSTLVALSQSGAAALSQPKWVTFFNLCSAIADTAVTRASSAGTLTGITIPCKEPYFCAAAATTDAKTGGRACPLSTMQAAVALLHQHWRIPVTLALNTTIPNRSNPFRPEENHDSSSSNIHSAGASSDGIKAVVEDFTLNFGGRRVLLVRGDTPLTQYGHSAPDVTSAEAELCTSADLVKCVEAWKASLPLPKNGSGVGDGVALTMAVAGYPQGHPLDRRWSSTEAAATTASGVAPNNAHASSSSSPIAAFCDAFEHSFNDADHLFQRIVTSHCSQKTDAPSLPALRNLFRTLGRLYAVRQLWLTPSQYSRATRAACARQLIEEKVLLGGSVINARNSSGGGEGGARVVVTQMLTSAQEFTEFEADVQRALRDIVTKFSMPSTKASPVGLTVVPGILLPHLTDPHVLLRSLYYAKVIPSVRLQRALETYRADLKSVWRSIVTHNNTTAEEEQKENTLGTSSPLSAAAAADDGSNEQTGKPCNERRNAYFADPSTWPGAVALADAHEAAAVEAFVTDAHRRATCRFTAAWMAETVDLLCALQKRNSDPVGCHRGEKTGTTPVHFFTMFNDKVDVRLAQLLDEYAARQRKEQKAASMCG